MLKWIKKNYHLFVILGTCIIVFNFFLKEEDYVEDYSLKIQALEAKVDSLHTENSELVKESKVLENQLANYDKRIKNLNLKINVIKNKTQQKIDAVDSFGDDELERFFTERYLKVKRQQKDTIN
tara:strand:+ start:1381 stop:1752 length:372 start_codon:yes stop_codon:yes gene_type:complete